MGAVVCSSSSYPVEPSRTDGNQPADKPLDAPSNRPERIQRNKNQENLQGKTSPKVEQIIPIKETGERNHDQKRLAEHSEKITKVDHQNTSGPSETLEQESVTERPPVMSEEQADNFSGVSPVELAEALSRIPRKSRSRLRSTPGRIESVRCWQEKRQEWRKSKYTFILH